jgi:hypothetical protein
VKVALYRKCNFSFFGSAFLTPIKREQGPVAEKISQNLLINNKEK